MNRSPWDQRIARVVVRPLARTPVTPNQMTTLTVLLALAAAVMFGTGDRVLANWAAGLFVLARFLDHFDGELARLKGAESRFGYYFDYFAGGLSFGALFLGLGIGLETGFLGVWAWVLGASGTASAVIAMFINLDIDRHNAGNERDAVGYPAFAGFELEDGIYLLAPITWFGFLEPFFIGAGVGAAIYCLWTLWTLSGMRRRVSGSKSH